MTFHLRPQKSRTDVDWQNSRSPRRDCLRGRYQVRVVESVDGRDVEENKSDERRGVRKERRKEVAGRSCTLKSHIVHITTEGRTGDDGVEVRHVVDIRRQRHLAQDQADCTFR